MTRATPSITTPSWWSSGRRWPGEKWRKKKLEALLNTIVHPPPPCYATGEDVGSTLELKAFNFIIFSISEICSCRGFVENSVFMDLKPVGQKYLTWQMGQKNVFFGFAQTNLLHEILLLSGPELVRSIEDDKISNLPSLSRRSHFLSSRKFLRDNDPIEVPSTGPLDCLIRRGWIIGSWGNALQCDNQVLQLASTNHCGSDDSVLRP